MNKTGKRSRRIAAISLHLNVCECGFSLQSKLTARVNPDNSRIFGVIAFSFSLYIFLMGKGKKRAPRQAYTALYPLPRYMFRDALRSASSLNLSFLLNRIHPLFPSAIPTHSQCDAWRIKRQQLSHNTYIYFDLFLCSHRHSHSDCLQHVIASSACFSLSLQHTLFRRSI